MLNWVQQYARFECSPLVELSEHAVVVGEPYCCCYSSNNLYLFTHGVNKHAKQAREILSRLLAYYAEFAAAWQTA